MQPDLDPVALARTLFSDAGSMLRAVEARHSVRTYDGMALRPEHRAFVDAYLDDPDRMTGPLGHQFRIVLLDGVSGDEDIGTYGYTKGFPALLIAIGPPEPLALFELAYVLHGLVLGLTHLGLGTVWMGGAFNRADVREATGVADDEIIAAIVPFGHAGDHKRLIDLAAPLVLRASKRKPMDHVYCYGDFGTPLGSNAGPLHHALDVARRAPSAKNRQPWRCVVARDHSRIDLYARFSLRDEVGTGRKQYACPPEYLDMGTYYRSLEIGLSHAGLRGALVVEEPGRAIPEREDMEYLASWVRR